jgi:hypothetical protein
VVQRETPAPDDKRKLQCGGTAVLLSAPSDGAGQRAARQLAPFSSGPNWIKELLTGMEHLWRPAGATSGNQRQIA